MTEKMYVVCKDVPYSWKIEYLGISDRIGWYICIPLATLWSHLDLAKDAAAIHDGYVREVTVSIGKLVD